MPTPSPPPPPPPPPQMPAQFMTTMMAAMPRLGERHKTVGCSLGDLFGHNSPMFDGGDGPLAADYVSRKQSLSLGAPSPPPFKRQSSGSGSGSLGRRITSVSQSIFSIMTCSKCGKTHPGKCHWGTTRACFECGQVGHYAKDCRQDNLLKQGCAHSHRAMSKLML